MHLQDGRIAAYDTGSVVTMSFFRQPFIDVLACLERLIVPNQRRQSPRVLFVVLASLIVTWFVYVPIHELLHVGGCVWTGGEVTRLELSARYGANLLKKVFPFISTGSDYAGQLKGFDTLGSDWCYFMTVFAPFGLTILIGVPLIKIAGRARRPVLLGVAVVVGLAPFYNAPGDYYEMGSILTTRALTQFIGPEPAPAKVDSEPADGNTSPNESLVEIDGGDREVADDGAIAPEEETPIIASPGGTQAAYAGIRSDDIYLLVGTIIEEPASLGLTSPGRIVIGCVLVLVSLVVDMILAFATYWAGHLFSRVVVPQPRPNSRLHNK